MALYLANWGYNPFKWSYNPIVITGDGAHLVVASHCNLVFFPVSYAPPSERPLVEWNFRVRLPNLTRPGRGGKGKKDFKQHLVPRGFKWKWNFQQPKELTTNTIPWVVCFCVCIFLGCCCCCCNSAVWQICLLQIWFQRDLFCFFFHEKVSYQGRAQKASRMTAGETKNSTTQIFGFKMHHQPPPMATSLSQNFVPLWDTGKSPGFNCLVLNNLPEHTLNMCRL